MHIEVLAFINVISEKASFPKFGEVAQASLARVRCSHQTIQV